jgi:uroporphyrinogen-III synthase
MLQLLLTRSSPQNELIREKLARPDIPIFDLPLLEAQALPEDPLMRSTILKLDQFDSVIFISKNAVQYGLPQLERYWPQWPVHMGWYSVGQGTARALQDFDIDAIYPSLASSEGLLALPQFSEVAGQSVLIVRGEGGRETLRQGLSQRGANVTYLEVYRRQPLSYPAAAFPDGDDVIALLYSGEAIEHLLSQLSSDVSRYTLIVPSKRLQELAISSGFDKVELANNQEDQAMIEVLLQLLEQRQ